MFRRARHLSPDELVQALDGTLPTRRLTAARRHLESCTACAERTPSLARRGGAAGPHDAGWQLAAARTARARLRAALREVAADAAAERTMVRGGAVLRRLGVSAAAAAAVLACAFGLRDVGVTVSSGQGLALLRPRPDLTPGAVGTATAAELCAPRLRGRGRPIPDAVTQRVFTAYGADVRRATEYELDHLITPELGGTSDPQNLWPQPYFRVEWNAFVKDELERHLHRLVCAGELDVRSAQLEIATDWIAAYKRRFSTDRPLRDYAAEPLTRAEHDLLLDELDEAGIGLYRSHDGPLAGRAGDPVLDLVDRARRFLPSARRVTLL
jgi:hypothetical protein